MALLAAYSFSEGSGLTVADQSGNGNTITLTSTAEWTASGKTGSAFSNESTSGYGDIPLSGLTFTNAATIEAWVYRANWGETGHRAFGAANPAGNNDGLVMAATGGSTARPVFIITATTGYHFIYADASWGTLAAGWHHLAGVYDGAQIRIYIDGTLAGTKTSVTGNLDLNTGLGFDVGRNAAASGGLLSGRVDDLRIYNHALTLSEIQTDMNTPVGGEAPTTKVTATAPTAWSTRQRVTDTAQTAWNVRAKVTQSAGTSWSTRSKVTTQAGTAWAVRGRVSATAPTSWSTRAVVQAARQSAWGVRARVGTSVDTAWNVVGAPGKVRAEVATAWDVAARLGVSVNTAWAVLVQLERVLAQHPTAWAVRARVRSTSATSWDVGAAPVITIKVSAGPAGRNLAPVDGPRR